MAYVVNLNFYLYLLITFADSSDPDQPQQNDGPDLEAHCLTFDKGADQAARMRRLVCACVIRNTPKTGFLASRPILQRGPMVSSMGPKGVQHFLGSNFFSRERGTFA